jgi:hypothetical protein
MVEAYANYTYTPTRRVSESLHRHYIRERVSVSRTDIAIVN